MNAVYSIVLSIVCFGILVSSSADDSIEPEEPKAYLGIFAHEINDTVLRTHLKLPDKTGLLVVAVIKDSPADKAELKVNDILLSIDDVALTGMKQLQTLIYEKAIGGSVSIKLIREGQEKVIQTVLGERPFTRSPDPAANPHTVSKTSPTVVVKHHHKSKKNKVSLEMDVDTLLNIYNDPSLTQKEKDKKANEMLTKDVLKGIKLEILDLHKTDNANQHKREIEAALKAMPPATQERIRKDVFDANGNVRKNVRLMRTKKGPVIVFQEEADK